jgi:hypothetical protein
MKETQRISKTVWKVVLVYGVIGAFLLFGCNSLPGLFATNTPTITATSTPTSTPTVVPTKTPRPTSTATPLPTWVTGFVQPILSAIADKPPIYQDDFSNPNSGWGYGKRTDGWYRGEYGYQDGEYFIVADPATTHPPDLNKVTCNTISRIPSSAISDFVFEIEGRFVNGSNGIWQIHFRDQGAFSANFFNYSVFRDTWGIRLIRNENRNMTDLPDQSSAEVPLAHFTDTDYLQIIAKGPQFAILINGVPVIFTNDPKSQGHESGKVYMEICNLGDDPLRVQFDNLKIWDISDLP